MVGTPLIAQAKRCAEPKDPMKIQEPSSTTPIDPVAAEKRRRAESIAAFFKPRPEEIEARNSQLSRLKDIAEEWRGSDNEPEETGKLSSGEFVAVCLAARHPERLRDPLFSFLLLDGWLQRWTMVQRGLEHLVGTKIGTDEF